LTANEVSYLNFRRNLEMFGIETVPR